MIEMLQFFVITFEGHAPATKLPLRNGSLLNFYNRIVPTINRNSFKQIVNGDFFTFQNLKKMLVAVNQNTCNPQIGIMHVRLLQYALNIFEFQTIAGSAHIRKVMQGLFTHLSNIECPFVAYSLYLNMLHKGY